LTTLLTCLCLIIIISIILSPRQSLLARVVFMSVAPAVFPGTRPRVACRRGARGTRCVASLLPADPVPDKTRKSSSRRIALGTSVAGALLVAFKTPSVTAAPSSGDWSSPGLGVVPDSPAEYRRTAKGVVYEQINDGVGTAAKAGEVAVFDYVLRRANGYFIYGSIDCGIGCGNGDPAEFVLGPTGTLIQGLDELLTGMRPGEKRRALIPPSLGYTNKGLSPQPPEFGQKRQVETHAREPLVFEVKLVKTRPGRG
jgi:hypothetical protein